jgi:hypothetical protein
MTINNELDLVQAIGRGRRKLEGKENCVVYDYRHPGVKGARGHGDTRDEVYSKRGFKVLGSKSTVIVSKYPIRRGFKAREA